MAGFIDNEAEGADLVFLGRDEEAAFLGSRINRDFVFGEITNAASLITSAAIHYYSASSNFTYSNPCLLSEAVVPEPVRTSRDFHE